MTPRATYVRIPGPRCNLRGCWALAAVALVVVWVLASSAILRP